MKILLDECIDWRLGHDILGHDVRTVLQMGWQAIRNGELLARASREFDALITVDANIAFQQNLESLNLTIVVISAPTNRLADQRPLIPKLLAALEAAAPGIARIVTIT